MTPYLHMVPGALLLAGALADLMGQGEASRRGPWISSALLLSGVLAVGLMMFVAAFRTESDGAVLWIHRGFAVAASITALGALALRPVDRKQHFRRQQLRLISVGLVGLFATVAVAGGFAGYQDPKPATADRDVATKTQAGSVCRPLVSFEPTVCQ